MVGTTLIEIFIIPKADAYRNHPQAHSSPSTNDTVPKASAARLGNLGMGLILVHFLDGVARPPMLREAEHNASG